MNIIVVSNVEKHFSVNKWGVLMNRHENRTNEIRIAVQHADEMLRHNAFEPALLQGQEILKLFPSEPNALFILGCAFRGLGRLVEAKKTLQKLVQQTQKFALAHQELAFTLHDLKQTKLAITALQKALIFDEITPDVIVDETLIELNRIELN